MSIMEVTTKIGCSLRCEYCPQDKIIKTYSRKSDQTLMSFDTFKICIDKLSTNVDIHFSGMSEPWLNPECTKMLSYADQKGHSISIFTTLAGMNMKDIKIIQKIPLKKICLHLCNNNIDIDSGYLYLLEEISKGKQNIQYHYHLKDIHQEVIDLLSDKTISYMPIIDRAGNLEKKQNNPVKKRQGAIICRRKLKHNVLLPNGDVLLCCMDYGMKHILGNLVEDNYSDLFNNREFINVRKGLLDDSVNILCRHCNLTVPLKNYL